MAKAILTLITILFLGLAVSGQTDALPKAKYFSGGSFETTINIADHQPEIEEKGVINGIGYRITYRNGRPTGGLFDGPLRRDESGIGLEELERRFGSKYEQLLIGCSKDRITDRVTCDLSLVPGIAIGYAGGRR